MADGEGRMDAMVVSGTGGPRKWVSVCAGGAIALALLGIISHLLFWPSRGGSISMRSAVRPVGDGGGTRELPEGPVEVPVALLEDYYEHTIEHTAPRDPTGAMQRRERHYRAPGDPFGILEQRLGKANADAALLRKIRQWREKWEAGKLARPPERADVVQLRQRFGGRLSPGVRAPNTLDADVGDLARHSSLKANDLLEIGRAFDFLSRGRGGGGVVREGARWTRRTWSTTRPSRAIRRRGLCSTSSSRPRRCGD